MCKRRLADHVVEKRKRVFLSKLKKVHGSSVVLLSTYRTVNGKIEAACKDCDTQWTTTPKRLTNRKQGCPKCSVVRRGKTTALKHREKAYNKLISVLSSKYDSKIKCLTSKTDYLNHASCEYDDYKVLFECECGNKWRQTPKVLINYNLRYACNACASKASATRARIPLARRLAAIDIIHDGTIAVMSKVKESDSSSKKVLFECSECGHLWRSKLKLVAAGSGCQPCGIKYLTRTPKRLSYAVELAGEQHILLGYEPQAVGWILKNTKFAESDIGVNPKNFQYKFEGKSRTYIPDLEISAHNSIIEVKSLYTAGLEGKSSLSAKAFRNLKAKASAVERSGFRFILMVMRKDGSRVKIPKLWQSMTRKQVRAALQS